LKGGPPAPGPLKGPSEGKHWAPPPLRPPPRPPGGKVKVEEKVPEEEEGAPAWGNVTECVTALRTLGPYMRPVVSLDTT
jgi:hypothetical protein